MMDQAQAPTPVRRRSLAPLSLAVAAVVVTVDQLTKHWAVNALDDGRVIHVIWTLQLNLTFNSGMAFSQAEGLGPIIAVVALGVLVALLVSLRRTDSKLSAAAVGLVIGGALGNLLDRVFRGDDGFLQGGVVDFFDLQWWPIFNVADAAIVVGGILLVIGAVRSPAEPAAA